MTSTGKGQVRNWKLLQISGERYRRGGGAEVVDRNISLSKILGNHFLPHFLVKRNSKGAFLRTSKQIFMLGGVKERVDRWSRNCSSFSTLCGRLNVRKWRLFLWDVHLVVNLCASLTMSFHSFSSITQVLRHPARMDCVPLYLKWWSLFVFLQSFYWYSYSLLIAK